MKLAGDLLARATAWGTLLTAIGVSAYLAVAPSYASQTVSETSTGEQHRSSGSETLAAVNGPIVYALFVVVILVAALPLLFRRSRMARPAAATSAGLLLIFALLSSASIGVVYLPVAALALLNAVLTPAARPE